jgi:probable F420-dependent oxidoreductase
VAFRFGIAGGALLPYLGDPAATARAAEECGFESLTFSEHTHIPVTRRPGMDIPEDFVRVMASAFDPFVAMTAAAVATTRLHVGTSVALIPEHHPISMAKAIASLDQVSNGRLFLGIGAAWNEEVENHGVAFADRWAVTRERIAAMRTIWTNERPEFHGEHVNFDPIWCDPKPVQPGGPPILMGSNSRQAIRRVVEYCDGWMPADNVDAFADGVAALRVEAERGGRRFEDLRIEPLVSGATRETIERLMEAGATKIHLQRDLPDSDGQVRAQTEQLAELVEPFRR